MVKARFWAAAERATRRAIARPDRRFMDAQPTTGLARGRPRPQRRRAPAPPPGTRNVAAGRGRPRAILRSRDVRDSLAATLPFVHRGRRERAYRRGMLAAMFLLAILGAAAPAEQPPVMIDDVFPLVQIRRGEP